MTGKLCNLNLTFHKYQSISQDLPLSDHSSFENSLVIFLKIKLALGIQN